MSRFKKILLWVALPLVLILVIAAIVLGVIVKSFVDRDSIAAWIEAEKNCRVEIGSLDAKLFGGKIVISDLKLYPRDEHADAGTALDQRPAAVFNQTGITVKKATLDAKITDLLAKKLSIRDLSFDGLSVNFLMERDGTPSLDPLFDPPKTVKGAANTDYEEKKKRRELAKELAKQRAEEGPNAKEPIAKQSFNIEELPIPATMDKLRITNGNIYMKLRKSKTRVHLANINLELSNLDIDPADLKAHNSAELQMDTDMSITFIDKKVEPPVTTTYANLKLHAEGKIAPFDPVTGYLNPDLVTNVTVKENSEIFSLPLVEKLASTLDKLKKAGLDVSDLEDTLVINEDATLRLGWQDSSLRLAEDVPVVMNGHVLKLGQGSWLHTGSNEHEIPGELTFSSKTSSSALGKANETLTNLVGADLAQSVGELLFTPITKDGNLHVPFTSNGDFGRPKVTPRIELMDLSDVLKSEAKDDAINLLEGLLKNR